MWAVTALVSLFNPPKEGRPVRSSRVAVLPFAVLVLVATGCSSSSKSANSTTTSSTSAGSTTGVPASASTTSPSSSPFLATLSTVSPIGSTVPANGDVNPYGLAIVAASSGKLVAGDMLVSNFNSKANVQGTGTTLVQVSPKGSLQLFADLSHLPANDSCPGGVGLSTARAILPGGWVVVGSLPTGPGGALPTPDPVGCLIVLNNAGTPVETITNANIVGPWDMATTSTPTSASLFISNALGGNTSTNNGVPVAGNCTVVRVDLTLSATAPPKVAGTTVIGSAFPWKADKTALVLAPTGLALGTNGTLYVDDTETNSISAIPNAATRTTAMTAAATQILSGGGLNAPLGMVAAPNGDLIVVNGNDGNATEVTPAGTAVAHKTLIKNGAGDLFGLAVTPTGNGIVFVNDGANTLNQYHA
jgi:hypothetical protein